MRDPSQHLVGARIVAVSVEHECNRALGGLVKRDVRAVLARIVGGESVRYVKAVGVPLEPWHEKSCGRISDQWERGKLVGMQKSRESLCVMGTKPCDERVHFAAVTLLQPNVGDGKYRCVNHWFGGRFKGGAERENRLSRERALDDGRGKLDLRVQRYKIVQLDKMLMRPQWVVLYILSNVAQECFSVNSMWVGQTRRDRKNVARRQLMATLGQEHLDVYLIAARFGDLGQVRWPHGDFSRN